MADRAVVEQGINWVMAFAIGAVALGFGVFFLFDPGNATTLIAGLISFALLLGSLIHLLQGLRRHANEFAARAALLSGGVGVTVGAIVTLDLFYDYLTDPAARVILAAGLIVYGVLGLAGMIVERVPGTVIRTTVTCAVALALAALLLYNSQDAELNARWFGVALLVTGLLLLGLGYFARNHQARLLAKRQGGTASSPESPRPVGPSDRTDSRPAPDRSAGGRRETTGRPQSPVVGHASPGDPAHEVTGGAATSPLDAPIVGQPPVSVPAPGGSAPTMATPAGQPGQDTRNRLLERDRPRSEADGPGSGDDR